jgi:hypothetical protein
VAEDWLVCLHDLIRRIHPSAWHYQLPLFLWFSDSRNKTWQAIMTREWANKAVSLSAVVIRNVVYSQAGISSAMLAALALEGFDSTLEHAAKLNLMRAGYGILPYHVVFPMWRNSRKLSTVKLTIIICSLFVTTFLLQFTSTALLSDLQLKYIPGLPKLSNIPTPGPLSKDSGNLSPLHRKPEAYPTFAEYSEPPIIHDGVSDTGLTLRAFPPLIQVEDRTTLAHYTGPAMVLDARVFCQAPHIQLKNIAIGLYGSLTTFEGTYRPSVISPLNPEFPGLAEIQQAPEVDFNCTADDPSMRANERLLIICALMSNNPLINLKSEFKRPPYNLSGGSSPLPLDFKSLYEHGQSYLVSSLRMKSDPSLPFSTINDLNFTSVGNTKEWNNLASDKVEMSVTLCHTPWDLQNLNVSFSSSVLLIEPTPKWNPSALDWSYRQIRKQLGQNRHNSLISRNIPRLEKQSSWLVPEEDSDFNFLKSGPDGSKNEIMTPRKRFLQDREPALGDIFVIDNEGKGHFASYFDRFANVDSAHANLLTEILSQNGTMSFALQSLLTTVTGMLHYDYLSVHTASAEAELSYLHFVQAPVRTLGFSAVIVVIAMHLILVTIVLVMFLRDTRFSMLDNVWHANAQFLSKDTYRIFEHANMMSDKEATKSLKEEASWNMRAGIALDESLGKVTLQLRKAYHATE